MSRTVPNMLLDLRDIHSPAPPSWWPPAYGWWIVAITLLALLGFAAWRFLARYRRMRPYLLARKEAQTLTRQRLDFMLSPRAYADAVNALYKRILVHVENRRDVIELYGQPWLQCLSERFKHSGFVNGAGAPLGSERFEPRPLDDSELPELVISTLAKVSPPPRQKNPAGHHA